MSGSEPKMDVGALQDFLRDTFPQVAEDVEVIELVDEGVAVRMRVRDMHLRPGGTVSGPAMFGLADVAIYLAILSRIGPVALAVTTGGSVDFMRKPAAGSDLRATARLLKLGRTLAVGDVLVWSDGVEEPVARASMTYSIPPDH